MIDIRANTTCSLGEVITASVSDSYLQEAGLVFTKGSLQIVGSKVPSPGTSVKIEWEGGGGKKELPRQMYVLSSFADPLRNTTSISLGCYLTWLEGFKPTPLEEGKATYITPDQMRCRNGDPASKYPQPINAQDALSFCCAALGIAFSGPFLENPYMVERLDCSSGYINIIAQLLQSESCIGWSDGSRLTYDKLGSLGGNLSLDRSNIIDIQPVNSGQMAAQLVTSPYIDNHLAKPGDDDDFDNDDQEEDEIEYNPVYLKIPYDKDSEGNDVYVEVSYTPKTKVVTYYGEKNAPNDNCDIFDSGVGDLSNSVIKRVTTTYSVSGALAPDYTAAQLKETTNGNTSFVNYQSNEEIVKTETWEYDSELRPIRVESITEEPGVAFAGRLKPIWICGDGKIPVFARGTTLGTFLDSPFITTSRTVTVYEYTATEGNQKRYVKADGGKKTPAQFAHTKMIEQRFTAYGLTQQGSQGIAGTEKFASASELKRYIMEDMTPLVLTDSQIQSDRSRNPIGGETRPSAQDRVIQDWSLYGERETKYAAIRFSGGSGQIVRVQQYATPMQGESYINEFGLLVKYTERASQLAGEYAKEQNKLAFGNRFGMNVQALAESLICRPNTRLSIDLQGVSGLYRTNGMAWQFNNSGVICSVDAVLIGLKGSSGAQSPPNAPDKPTWTPTEPGRDPSRPIPPVSIPTIVWLPLPPSYDPDDPDLIDKLPDESDGIVIPPYDELNDVQAGIRIGLKFERRIVLYLPAREMEVGIKIGVAANRDRYMEVGVNLGVAVIAKSAVVRKMEVGIALGVERKKALVRATKSLGIKVGTLLGPKIYDAPLHFSFDNPGADNVPINKGSAITTFSKPCVSGSARYSDSQIVAVSETHGIKPKFGNGMMEYKTPDEYGNYDCTYGDRRSLADGKIFDFDPRSWTIEMWVYIDPDMFVNGGGRDGSIFGLQSKPVDSSSLEYRMFELTIQARTWDLEEGYFTVGYKTGFQQTAYMSVGEYRYFLPNQWNHIAFTVRKTGHNEEYDFDIYTLHGYINGYLDTTKDFPTEVDRSPIKPLVPIHRVYFADDEGLIDGQKVCCMIDELRVVNESIYTGNTYTVPSAPFN